MKNILTILLVALCTTPIFAQPNVGKMLSSPAFREIQAKQQKKLLQSQWDGTGSDLMLVGIMQRPEARAVWGVTEEQSNQVMSSMMAAFTDPNSEYAAEAKEMGELLQSGKAFGDNSTPESEARYLEIQERMQAVALEKMAAAANEVLTDEQKTMAQEFQLASMGESPFVSPESFQMLGLSEDQLAQMNAIRKDLTPQFNQYLDELSVGQSKLADKLFAGLEIDGEIKDPVEFGKKIQEKAQRLAEDPEFKKIAEEMSNSGIALATQFRTKMFDVLTDEQWKKLTDLVDNPPEHVKKMQASLKKMSGQDGESDTEAAFNPMDSWKPGEPIPEEYRKKRALKPFPQTESQK